MGIESKVDKVKLGQRLQELRKQNNYSQEKLAEIMKLSRTAVAHWERGMSAPSNDNLVELAELYHISIDDIMSESEYKQYKETYKNRYKSLEIIEIEGYVDTYLEFMEDRFMNQYTCWIFDGDIPIKMQVGRACRKHMTFYEFKNEVMNNIVEIVKNHREWLSESFEMEGENVKAMMEAKYMIETMENIAETDYQKNDSKV